MKICVYTHIGNYGQYVDALEITSDEPILKAALAGHYCDLSGYRLSAGVLRCEETAPGTTRLTVDPFLYRYDFTLTVATESGEESFAKGNFDEVKVLGLDEFEALTAYDVLYRLYTPSAPGKRPLVLFLHGAGEVGTDNLAQMTGTIGALELAKRFPDMYVMAPQSSPEYNSIYGDGEERFRKEYRFTVKLGMTPPCLKGDRGWNRDLLVRVCRIIREMIADGRVDQSRVYVTGMSMGGCGTIQAVSVDPDLFAAAAPICPTMNGEALGQLMHLPEVPMWITTAYIDHQPDRHAHILKGCNELWRSGRTDVRYTMYTSEELAAYGIGTTPGITTEELYVENHNSWIPTLNNEMGILTWMISQHK